MKRDNKGFSLMEIVVAVALFAIVVVPVMASIVSSIRLNQRSRKLMIANDTCQTVMEGFAGMTFDQVAKTVATHYGTDDVVSGANALSTISANAYNTKANIDKATSWPITMIPESGIKPNQITVTGLGTISSNDLISGNNARMVNGFFANYARTKITAGDYTPKLVICMDSHKTLLFLGYLNVRSEGYYQDILVQFIPMAPTADSKYYSYEAMAYVYEFDQNTAVSDRMTGSPQITMTTGIKNRNN